MIEPPPTYRSHNRDGAEQPAALLTGIFFLLVLGALVTASYFRGAFTGDGFHYYSALRNFIDGYGAWEGPVFEHLFGNHAYLTLYLLAPAVGVFRSPLVLLYAGLFSWFISAFVFYRFMRRLFAATNDPAGPTLSVALALAYLCHPLVLQCALGYGKFLFQPDCLLAPGLMLLAMAFFVRNAPATILSMLFVVWTKEEYIPLLPALFLWLLMSYRFLYGSVWPDRRHVLSIAVTYLAASALSLAVLFFYRQRNEYQHVSVNLHAPSLPVLPSLLVVSLLYLLPLAPFLMPVIGNRRTAIYFVGFTAALTAARTLIDMVVYGSALSWLWGHTIIPPVLFITLAIALAQRAQEGALLLSARTLAYSIVLSAAIMTGLPALGGLNASSLSYHFGILTGRQQIRPEYLRQIIEISDALPEPQRLETVMVPEHLMFPLMDRSHISIDWAIATRYYRKPTFVDNVSYLIIPKEGTALRLFSDIIESSYILHHETEDFFVYRSTEL